MDLFPSVAARSAGACFGSVFMMCLWGSLSRSSWALQFRHIESAPTTSTSPPSAERSRQRPKEALTS